jgi:hypothetical protein
MKEGEGIAGSLVVHVLGKNSNEGRRVNENISLR